ncbi:hypothetical protein JVU11DRAFT_6568 [Chiua virens]|nr:hypothetical protein JVU11DRAFT_6568 [Chiua virens]
MADCGICLDLLRNPVSVPCGHVHCERCLRGHISSGADALKSTCPTCRKSFNIATPDFAFVPPKYHDFILPSVRKIYMDIPSLTVMSKEMDVLRKGLDSCAAENEQLRQRVADLKYKHEESESKIRASVGQAKEARREAADLRRKYDSLTHKYWEALETASRDTASIRGPSSQSLSRRSSHNFDISRELVPKVEEHLISLHDLNPPRPKRALPKSRLANSMRHKDEQDPLLVKRQRTHRHSDVGSSSHHLRTLFKGEDDEDEE